MRQQQNLRIVLLTPSAITVYHSKTFGLTHNKSGRVSAPSSWFQSSAIQTKALPNNDFILRRNKVFDQQSLLNGCFATADARHYVDLLVYDQHVS
uniref:Uncharacterized protein n=1 Tax=Heterorhabditis bacteriophora TaxID=37862 RepID=A0A1I7WJW9_HETBA